MNLLFDTNILVYYIRKSPFADEITNRFKPFNDETDEDFNHLDKIYLDLVRIPAS
jgi:hypothetical protein